METTILPVQLPGSEENMYAGFWSRVGAFLIDMFISYLINYPLQHLMEQGKLYYYILIPVSTIVVFIYNIYFVKLWGATPGKRIIGLMIIKKNGQFISWKEAILRHSVELSLTIVMTITTFTTIISLTNEEYIKSGINGAALKMMADHPFLITTLGTIMVLWMWSEYLVLLLNKRKRALHDYIAGTVVVKRKYNELILNYRNSKQTDKA